MTLNKRMIITPNQSSNLKKKNSYFWDKMMKLWSIFKISALSFIQLKNIKN